MVTVQIRLLKGEIGELEFYLFILFIYLFFR